jgi:hypothetical protein
MAEPVSSTPSQTTPDGAPLSLSTARRWALLACVAVTVWRLFELFSNPINLSFDEAQYWGWAQDLDWGYFSKPPMIAWVIWLTTAIGQSDAEPYARRCHLGDGDLHRCFFADVLGPRPGRL